MAALSTMRSKNMIGLKIREGHDGSIEATLDHDLAIRIAFVDHQPAGSRKVRVCFEQSDLEQGGEEHEFMLNCSSQGVAVGRALVDYSEAPYIAFMKIPAHRADRADSAFTHAFARFLKANRQALCGPMQASRHHPCAQAPKPSQYGRSAQRQ